jgi:hypothetical protein
MRLLLRAREFPGEDDAYVKDQTCSGEEKEEK